MTDEELIARLRDAPADGLGTENLCLEAADRIDALTKERDQHWDSFVHWHKQADDLTGQLAAAQHDAKEAEAYAEEVERELRDTQDRANAFATKEYYTEMRAERAEAKLAKALEALEDLVRDCEADYPPSHGAIKYFCRTTLAEIKGESHDPL